MTSSPTAVLLMAYGGPDSLEDIEAYLLDIRGGRPTSPQLVAEIRERYALIGGRSPLLEITRAQAGALQDALNTLATSLGQAADFRFYVGMRHWKPYIREALAQMQADGCRSGLAFCMAPHASKLSSEAYLQKMRAGLATLQAPPDLQFVESWFDQAFLVNALARKVHQAEQQFPSEARANLHYLFTAHSLPASLREQGDPYDAQVHFTAAMLAQQLGLDQSQWTFGFQSAGAAPGAWLGPSVEELLPQLAAQGHLNVLVTPVGFMADHVEVLYDLDIEAQAIARELNLRLVRSQSLNASPDFIDGLAKFLFEKMASKTHEHE